MRSWLKEIRESSGLSQTQLAEKARIPQGYYSEIETGVKGSKLPVATAKRIADVLNFDWTQFYDESQTDQAPTG